MKKEKAFFIKQTLITVIMFVIMVPLSHSDDWVYTTRPGDSIWNISKRFLVNINDWKKLQTYNEIKLPHALQPGTKIHIPYTWLRNQPKSARLVAAQGTVTVIEKSGNPVKIENNLPLNSGYQIQTETDSYAIIEFADGSRLSVQENSILILNQINYFENAAIVDTQMRLKRGNVSSTVIPFKKPQSRFEINTPAAVAAVRGTNFHVQVPNETSMLSSVDGGTVSVSNSQGESVLNEGFGTITEKGKPPAPPIQLLAKVNLTQLKSSFIDENIKFHWRAIENASTYYSEIQAQDGINKIVYAFTSHQPIVKTILPTGGNYLLSVRAIDQIGLQGLTATHKFHAGFVVDNSLGQPKLNSPNDGFETLTKRPTFHWINIAKAENYRMQVSLKRDFSELIVDHLVEQQFFRIESPLKEGEYYWRVAAISSNAEQGPFSDIFTIVIK